MKKTTQPKFEIANYLVFYGLINRKQLLFVETNFDELIKLLIDKLIIDKHDEKQRKTWIQFFFLNCLSLLFNFNFFQYEHIDFLLCETRLKTPLRNVCPRAKGIFAMFILFLYHHFSFRGETV